VGAVLQVNCDGLKQPQTNSNSFFENGNTPQCVAWRQRIYKRHLSIASYLEKQHSRIARAQGFFEANQWLLKQDKAMKIGGSSLYCDCPYDSIKDYAEAKSKKIEKQIHESAALIGTATQTNKDRIVDYIRDEVEKTGIDFPLEDSEYDKNKVISALARVCDASWWRKQIYRKAVQQFEKITREAGTVSLSGDIYCSTFTFRRRQEQKKRNRRLLESLEAENSQGQVFTLAELADLSVSNPINRRHELMTRIGGFDRYAQNQLFNDPLNGSVRYVCVFLTLTAPSKYHVKTVRKNANGGRYAIPNKKFAGATPKETNEYLCSVFARIRSEWDRRDIKPFGFRMVEPHHDGTPHWHMVLFIPECRLIETCHVFQHYALEEDSEEYGAQENRVDMKFIDPLKGSAAGYCSKYVSKNIDGFGVDTDHYGRDAVMSALRIEAWASTWGIRQFQQIGGPSVTVWREARRIKNSEVDCEVSPDALPILDAADLGDWETYTELMGGAICKKADRPIRPMMISTRKDFSKYDESRELLIGLLVSGSPVITRGEIWKVQPVGTAKASEDSWHSSLRAFHAPHKAA